MFPPRLKLTDNLLTFEKSGRLLLANGAEMKPLLINRGKEFILAILADIDRIRDTREVLQKYRDERLLEAMVEHRILVCEHDPERYPAPSTGQQTDASPGMSLYLLLSQGCNLGCIYCLNGEKTYKKSERLLMNEEVAFRAVEMCLKKLAPGGELEIVFFGGEPLLNWPLVKKTILYCEEVLRKRFLDRGWRYHITTNLTIFPADFVDWVKKYRISILCDVDGPPGIHNLTRPFKNGRGSHDRIARNIARLRKEGIEVALRSTVTSHNVDSMPEVAEHHKELGGSGCAFVPVNAVTSDEEILPPQVLPDPGKYARGLRAVFESGIWEVGRLFPFNQYLDRIRPGARMFLPCGAPYGNTPVVDVNGDVYACIYLVGIKSYKIGNIFSEESFPKRDVTARMMELLRVDNIEECRRCSLRYVCVSGCPVGKLLIEGNPKAGEEVKRYTREIKCAGIRAIVESILWNYAEVVCQELRASEEQRGLCV